MLNPIQFVVCLLPIFFLAGCQPSGFKGTSPRRQPATDPAKSPVPIKPNGDDAGPAKPVTEEFSLEKTAGGVDMVWLIDTSGSMREEAAQVQRNFTSFANTLSSRSGTKFALIANKPGSSSGFGSSIGIDLGTTSTDRMQIEVGVGSTNALALAASAVCPANTSTGSTSGDTSWLPTGGTTTICGQTISNPEASNRVTEISGRLAGFFRADAKPVFVVVTDDNARGVTDQNFMSMVQPHLGGKTPTVYAFRGTQDRPGCNVARPGIAYEKLATASGGTVFDICEADWSPNFSSLGQAVLELIKSTFDLKNPVTRMVGVYVDGQLLAESEYSVTGQTLTLQKNAVPADGKLLKISYETTP